MSFQSATVPLPELAILPQLDDPVGGRDVGPRGYPLPHDWFSSSFFFDSDNFYDPSPDTLNSFRVDLCSSLGDREDLITTCHREGHWT